MKLNAACVQFTAGPDWPSHAEAATALIQQAADAGARLIVTPENTGGIRKDKEKARAEAPIEAQHPAIAAFTTLAHDLGVWLLCGSVVVRDKPSDKLPRNRSLLFGPNGRIYARYDKVHLFDVDLPTGEKHRESENIAPGAQAVLADAAGARMGLSVCYDVRFPQLYRKLAQAGAQILTVPAAFTVPTGQAHWEVLLRARAIENGAYVLAPAQTGFHEGGRQTWGHSLIIDPWGRVLEDAGVNPGIIRAELDMDEVAKARAAIPSLQHDREFTS